MKSHIAGGLGFAGGVTAVLLILKFGPLDDTFGSDEEPDSPVSHSEKGSSGTIRTRNSSSDRSGPSESTVREIIESGDPEKIKALIRSALEDRPVLLDRMAAVCEIVKFLDAENADAMRKAFDESWLAGFNYTWERQIFLTKFGEVAGEDAVESYSDDRFQQRVIAGWASAEPGDAVDWVNGLEPGQFRSSSINTLMWELGKDRSMYCVEVFKAFSEQEQLRKIGDLAQLRKRAGGAEACGELADHLYAEGTEHSKKLAARVYNSALDSYRNGSETDLNQWLDQLPKDVIPMLSSEKLPDRFQSEGN